ncbi:NADH-quinone oxidoreductase subunit N [Planotetraspora phitsanulokensis]|uniref:NADH-quinone oxidoreductase subunit N n=1 Tax=Planotetraspora phitsanulokensis TaxID=575192 RepID=A0A8J3U653_9ACTN|nr:NADH-quinone oxidoreductase subunit N [Planotetraspora phitsanulokensis]GII37846.1 NADH-quinone oxidoreductase subunit N [Planotetraspora phitsanulokensis]
MIQSIDYTAIAVPLILALTAGLVLVLDAFLPARPGGGRLLGVVALGGVAAALAVLVAQAVQGGVRRTFCVPASLGGGESCSFVLDRFTLVFTGLVLAAGVVVVLLSMAELTSGRVPVGEWYFLLLGTLTGAVLLAASRDLIMLVVSLELVSLPVFALTAMRRYDGRASEAALKLFLVSVVSTAIMLFGVSLMYGVTGSVYLDRIAAFYASGQSAAPAGVAPGVTTVAIVLVLAGFAFKVAAVPFHFWAADVYQGAPIPVAALLSVISKAAGFAGLILILTTALASQAAVWAPVVAVIAALTMTAGNVLAMRQRQAVRLLAWSSVAQSGYILAPLAAFAGVPRDAAGASVAYLAFYAAMNLVAFGVVMLVARARERNDLDDYQGLAFHSPVAALSLAFSLICLAGLPPGLAGLFAKVVVFRAIVDGGLGWLAVVMAANTVIGLYYYIAWTARLFTPLSTGASRPRSGPVAVAVGLAVAVTLAFSVAPQVVLSAVG